MIIGICVVFMSVVIMSLAKNNDNLESLIDSNKSTHYQIITIVVALFTAFFGSLRPLQAKWVA
jgi:hypothetical protein